MHAIHYESAIWIQGQVEHLSLFRVSISPCQEQQARRRERETIRKEAHQASPTCRVPTLPSMIPQDSIIALAILLRLPHHCCRNHAEV